MNNGHLEFLASEKWAEMLASDLVPWLERTAELGEHVLEVGPGPGLTTDLLRVRAGHVTAVELDEDLARALRDRLADTNVEVLQGDAAVTGLPSDHFSAATCFSVLHHVPTAEAQDRIFTEIHRVLQPGAPLVATDSRDLDGVRTFHAGDVFNPLPVDSLVSRLEQAGFVDVELEVSDYELRFAARKPAVA